MEEYRPILKNRKFVHLWASQIFSQVTINIMNFLLLIRLFNETGSTIATSFLWVAYALPAILIGPIAAASVDMTDRRKVLMFSNLFQSATIFLYAFSHQQSLFLLYGVVLVYSFFNQFYVPAEQASLPDLVKHKYLPQANGLFFITQQSAIIFGFGIAGILFNTIGFETSLYLCASLIFLAFISVTFLDTMKVKDEVPKNFEKAIAKFFNRIIQGYSFIKDNHSIFAPFVLLMGVQIVLAIIVVNVPVIATQILGVSPEISGVILIVPAGIGALIGALSIPKLLTSGWRKKRVIEYALIGMTTTLFVYVFLVPEIQDDVIRVFAGIMTTILAGLSFVSMVIPSQTFLQEKTPGGLRGRVFGNFWFLVTIATVFPVILSGTIAELFGVRVLFTVLTGVSLFALLSFKKWGQQVLETGIPFLNSTNKNGKK